MAELKTKPTAVSVDAFIAAIADEARRADCLTLVDLMRKVTKQEPTMWGPSIIGFGSIHYRYDTGHEGDTCLLGFASRKPDITIYLNAAMMVVCDAIRSLGKCKASKGCLYIRRLADVDLAALRRLLTTAAAHNKKWAAARKPDAKGGR
jgi:hypothetical protein